MSNVGKIVRKASKLMFVIVILSFNSLLNMKGSGPVEPSCLLAPTLAKTFNF